jgi:hypothetical protein
MIPIINKPTILPSAAKIDFFQPYKVVLVIINKTAGPGVEAAARTNIKYINQDCVVMGYLLYQFEAMKITYQ